MTNGSSGGRKFKIRVRHDQPDEGLPRVADFSCPHVVEGVRELCGVKGLVRGMGSAWPQATCIFLQVDKLLARCDLIEEPCRYSRVPQPCHSSHLGWITLSVCGFPVHCRKFSSISDLYPLNTSDTPFHLCQVNMSLDIAKCTLGDKTALSWELLE